MNGVLFYLDRDVPIVNGHAIYIDSEWSLTSISQKQFWPGSTSPGAATARIRGHALDRRLGVAAAGPADRQGRQALHAARRSARRSGASSRTTSTTARSPGSRSSDRTSTRRSSSRTRRDAGQPRAAARQHGGLVGRPARRGHADPEPLARRRTTCARTPTSPRWRAPTRPPAARSTGSSTPGLGAQRCAVWRLSEPRGVRRRPMAGPGALAAVPPARAGAVQGHRRRRVRAHRDRRPRAAGGARRRAGCRVRRRGVEPASRSRARARRGRTPRPARARRCP